MKNKIAVLIPCYNEEKTIGSVIKKVRKALPDAKVYVYDNNSNDKTVEVALKNGALVKYEYKQGKGNVVRTMFREIDAECYVMIDGDDTYSVDEINKMCDLVLTKKADMVVGDRLSTDYFKENKRRFHGFGNKLVAFLIRKLFKTNVNDVMTGYRAFSYRFVKTFPVLSKGFEIETEMTIHAIDKGFNLVEIPVGYKDRVEGSHSKLNTYKDGFRVLKTIGILVKEYRPALFFNFFSVLILIVSVILMCPAFIEYFEIGLVYKFPSLIVGMVLLAIAMLMWVCGILLEVIANKHKQLYELIANQVKDIGN